jgi:mRNA interferase RelE/StbE
VSLFRVELRPGARTALLGLDKPARRRIQRAIDELADSPRPAGAVPLSEPEVFRIKVGEHRIVYKAGPLRVTILVIAEGPKTAGE